VLRPQLQQAAKKRFLPLPHGHGSENPALIPKQLLSLVQIGQLFGEFRWLNSSPSALIRQPPAVIVVQLVARRATGFHNPFPAEPGEKGGARASGGPIVLNDRFGETAIGVRC
jgi:hypothetical protein